MKSAIIKAITQAARPLTAQEIGAITGQAVTAVRLIANGMIETGTLRRIETLGAITRYALPQMQPTPDSRLPDALATSPAAPLSLDDLIADARAAPEKMALGKAGDYMPAMKILRERGHSWKDCEQWLRVRGHKVSGATLNKAHQQWVKSGANRGAGK